MLKHALVLCVVFVAASSFVQIAPLQPKPDKFKNVPGCYVSELDQVIPQEETAVSKTGCFQYRCGEQYIYTEGCGKTYIKPECKQIVDSAKPYPDCCPKEKC